jgi:MFS superfamily sulfate permease-like transporter
MLSKWLPGVRLLARYKRSWLRRDIVAGVVLSTLLVPQGMAYAELAGLPVITGLYTTVLCLLGYAVFGPSSRRPSCPSSARMAIPKRPSPWPPCSPCLSAASW